MSVENPLLWIWSPVIVIWWLMCWSRIQHRAWWPDRQTLDTVDTVDTRLVNGTKFHSVHLLVLSQLRIYAKWTQHRHEIKIVLKDHNRLAKTRVLKIIVPTVHPFLSHFTVRSAFRITLYLNSPLLCSKAKCCCHLYWPPITGNMTAVTLALLISPDTARCEDKEDNEAAKCLMPTGWSLSFQIY